jgi:hypothetical protein
MAIQSRKVSFPEEFRCETYRCRSWRCFFLFPPFSLRRTLRFLLRYPTDFMINTSAILEAYRSGNNAAGGQLIEGFRLSNPDEWFTENLGADRSAALTERYNKLFPLFAADLERNILDSLENKFHLVTVLKEGTEDPPSKLLPPMKLSGIKTTLQTALFYSTFDRQSGGVSISSWARAFTYQSGALRFVGYGSIPFRIWEKDAVAGVPKRPLQLTTLLQSGPPVYPASAR